MKILHEINKKSRLRDFRETYYLCEKDEYKELLEHNCAGLNLILEEIEDGDELHTLQNTLVRCEPDMVLSDGDIFISGLELTAIGITEVQNYKKQCLTWCRHFVNVEKIFHCKQVNSIYGQS